MGASSDHVTTPSEAVHIIFFYVLFINQLPEYVAALKILVLPSSWTRMCISYSMKECMKELTLGWNKHTRHDITSRLWSLPFSRRNQSSRYHACKAHYFPPTLQKDRSTTAQRSIKDHFWAFRFQFLIHATNITALHGHGVGKINNVLNTYFSNKIKKILEILDLIAVSHLM